MLTYDVSIYRYEYRTMNLTRSLFHTETYVIKNIYYYSISEHYGLTYRRHVLRYITSIDTLHTVLRAHC